MARSRFVVEAPAPRGVRSLAERNRRAAGGRRAALASVAALAALLHLPGCSGTPRAVAAGGTTSRIDSARLLAHVQVLAADSMEGRRTGTPGGERARRYLVAELSRLGVRPLDADYLRPFEFAARGGGTLRGVNVVGLVPGTERADEYLVLSAHYDHLGIEGGEIYNGADDNASGTSAVLAIAAYLRAHPPAHSVILALFDAEEQGLQGAKAFVAAPPVARERLRLSVNLDMVSRSAAGELFAVGTAHYPALRPPLDRVAARAPVTLRFGHDRPGPKPGDDWTRSSDHGAFHAVGIPFVYFGVEDHADYHKPTDDPAAIGARFFAGAVETILDALLELDRALLASR